MTKSDNQLYAAEVAGRAGRESSYRITGGSGGNMRYGLFWADGTPLEGNPGNLTAEEVVAAIKQRYPNAKRSNGYKSFTAFCKAVCDARSPDQHRSQHGLQVLHDDYGSGWKQYTGAVAKSAMGETSGSVGGFTLPVEYSTALMATLEENSFIYPRANIIPMGSAQTLCPMIDATTVPAAAGTSPFFGGVKFGWGFAQAPAETAEMKFRQVAMTAWDLLGYGLVSNQWLQDTPGGDDVLIRTLGRAAAWSAEYAFLNGTGAANLMPLGMLKSPALISATRAGGNHIVQADVAKMWGSLLPSSIPRAVWAVSCTAVEDLVKITSYSPNEYNQVTGDPNFSGSAGTIYTRPVYVTEKLPALGTVGDIMLIDPSLYAVGSRQECLVDITDQEPTAFTKNQSMFRVWMRMDGMPQLSSTVTLQDKATVVSAYVALAA